MYLLGRYGGWSAQQELWGYVADQILLLHDNNVEEQERMRFPVSAVSKRSLRVWLLKSEIFDA